MCFTNVSSPSRERRSSCILLILGVAGLLRPMPVVNSFCPSPGRIHTYQRTPTTLLQVAMESTAEDKFLSDLKKALSLRRFNFENPLHRHRRQVIKFDVDGAEKAVRMLRHMISIGAANEEAFQVVFESLLGRGRILWLASGAEYTCAANEMEKLLADLERAVDRVSMKTYDMVLEAYANCSNSRGNKGYAERAERLFERLEQPSVNSLFHMTRAYAWQQGNRKSVVCAAKAYDYMKLLESKNPNDELLSQAYDWVLEAFSKANGGAIRAEEIFQRRLKMATSAPIEDYTNIILAWAKDPAEISVNKATSWLEIMCDKFLANELLQDPEHIAFNGVINAWTKLDRPDRAEQILWLMEKKIRPKAPSLKPDVITYNSVCHGYIKDNDKITIASLNAISKIITYMEQNYKEQPLIKPDSYTYNTLIKALNLSGTLQTVEQMEEVLDRMESVLEGGKVTNKNFNAVINMYAKSGDKNASDKVLQLLDRMKKSDLVEPDTITYTTAMECLTKSPDTDFAADKALELLAEIQSLYETTQKSSIMPNSRTFTMAILALTRSTRADNVILARKLLDELNQLYEEKQDKALCPTAHAYNYVINSAANTFGDRIEAFKIAVRTYQELRDQSRLDIRPDSYTYAFWLKACNQLLPSNSPIYRKVVTLSFAQCCKEGMVSREVLARLKQGQLSYGELGQVLGCDSRDVKRCSIEDLPLSWTRNVK